MANLASYSGILDFDGIMVSTVNALVYIFTGLLSLGYERGKTLRGAPYDFRFAPHAHDKYLNDLKTLIEETYEINSQTPVVLLTHSIGGLFAMYFLNRQSHEWKEQYIRAFVPVSVPWMGSVLILQAFASGYNFGIKLVDPLMIRKQQRSYETNYLVVPKADAWPEYETLVETPNRIYTTGNYKEFFDDILYPVGYEKLQNIVTHGYDFENPGVDIFCFYGGGVPTAERLVYTRSFPDEEPSGEFSDGDGTVTSKSLSWCQKWRKRYRPGQQVQAIQLQYEKHTEILYGDNFHKNLKEIVTINTDLPFSDRDILLEKYLKNL